MRWDIGSVYKDIRKSKNLSQEEICGNTISRTTLSKFENNKLVPSYQTMEFLLRQVNVSFQEFNFLCNKDGKDKRQEIFNEFKTINNSSEIGKIKTLILKCEDLLKTEDDLVIKNYHRILTSYLDISLNNNSISNQSKEFVSEIWEDLKSMDTWYYNDLFIINSIIHRIPIATLPEIIMPILESTNKYKNYNNNSLNILRVCLFLNMSTLYLQNNMIKECIEITNLGLDYAKKLKNYYYLSYSWVRLGLCQGDKKMIEKGFSLAELTEEPDLLKEMLDEVEYYSDKITPVS
ncbi:helix-turn-helix domain-containing protein [Floricoccus penangensis]|uniref:helix-turn-helix domain-containing protein n=1 Tax=Floricoccus penangensis TaxID=1859475 RepID=UPI00203EF576|nr:helix-turn-helix transcriptional regulator [Floricoccus penangensis]URZ87105.1 helix-turn-helix domain-containing protein [Floricoccus penangensis]